MPLWLAGVVNEFDDASTVSTARNSAVVAGWTLVSRITGLLRVVVIGAVLGPTYFANSFQAGYIVPNIVFTLIAGSVLTMVVVPAAVHALGGEGLPRARQVLGRISGWLLAVCGIAAGVLITASPLVAWSLSFGIADPEQRARNLWLTTVLVVIVAPQVVLYGLVFLGIAAQQARGRFALAAAAPALENLVLITTVVGAGWYYGMGLDVGRAPVALVVTLGIGSTAATALHTAVQLVGAARTGLPVRPSMRWRQDPHAHSVTRRIARSVGVAAWPAAAMYVLLALAGSVPGGVFVVQLSYSVFYSLSYVSARAVSTAALPGLAHAASPGDQARFGSAWRQGLSHAMIASLPLLVLLAVLSGPTANILANGELRHAALIRPLALCLAVVAGAQLVGGVHEIARQALFARLDDRVPRRASEAAFAVRVIVAASSLLVPAGGWRLVWLVTAILAGELASAAMVLTRLRQVIHNEPFIETRTLGGTLLATLAIVPVATAVWWLQHAHDGGQLKELAILIPGGILALGTYALVLRLALPSQPTTAT